MRKQDKVIEVMWDDGKQSPYIPLEVCGCRILLPSMRITSPLPHSWYGRPSASKITRFTKRFNRWLVKEGQIEERWRQLEVSKTLEAKQLDDKDIQYLYHLLFDPEWIQFSWTTPE